MKAKHNIYILLSRHHDIISKMIYYITGKGYTHVSIGLVEEEECFYSFNGKGFRIEKPWKWNRNAEQNNKKEIGMMLYEISVAEEAYERIKNKIKKMKEQEKQYSYSPLGVILCLLHIPHKIKNHYFCSQFVAETLIESGEFKLQKKPSVYVPNSFIKEFMDHPSVMQIIYNPTFAQ